MRAISTQAKAELNKRWGGDCWLWIVEISHADMTTLRLTENSETVTFGGYAYQPWPLAIDLPSDSPDGLPDGTATFCNVDQRIYAALANCSSAPTVRIGLVLGNQQTVTERAGGAMESYKLKGMVASEDKLSCSLSMDMPYSEPIPAHYFDQAHYPKLFITPTVKGG